MGEFDVNAFYRRQRERRFSIMHYESGNPFGGHDLEDLAATIAQERQEHDVRILVPTIDQERQEHNARIDAKLCAFLESFDFSPRALLRVMLEGGESGKLAKKLKSEIEHFLCFEFPDKLMQDAKRMIAQANPPQPSAPPPAPEPSAPPPSDIPRSGTSASVYGLHIPPRLMLPPSAPPVSRASTVCDLDGGMPTHSYPPPYAPTPSAPLVSHAHGGAPSVVRVGAVLVQEGAPSAPPAGYADADKSRAMAHSRDCRNFFEVLVPAYRVLAVLNERYVAKMAEIKAAMQRLRAGFLETTPIAYNEALNKYTRDGKALTAVGAVPRPEGPDRTLVQYFTYSLPHYQAADRNLPISKAGLDECTQQMEAFRDRIKDEDEDVYAAIRRANRRE